MITGLEPFGSCEPARRPGPDFTIGLVPGGTNERLEIIMYTLHQAVRTLSVSLLAMAMVYGTVIVTFFHEPSRQGVNAPASVEPWS